MSYIGTILPGNHGGTGVANSSTITIGGNVTFSGANTFTGTLTGDTNVTFPTSGTLATIGGAFFANLTETATDYVVLSTDYAIGVTDTTSPRAITLPDATTNAKQIFVVKDESGGATVNNITITPAAGLIDGAATAVINSDYSSLTFISNGTNYFIL